MMKLIAADISASLQNMLLTLLLCCCIYTGTVWALGQVFVPVKAAGSLIVNDQGTVVGSRLIAQKFTQPGYFWSRPSAVDYNGICSGGSNLSPANPALRDRVLLSIKSLESAGSNTPIPLDLVTASGSGLDPHISIPAAKYQAERVATARGVDFEAVQAMIQRVSNQSDSHGLVNVLELNLLLDKVLSLPPR